ncbi:MAG: lysophospholipid acyltransferase family protein [Deltaproteobacteria bacterium]|nr:lysophospholipid acyltransferase family protein [Deltaproteobacteria bacterium]
MVSHSPSPLPSEEGQRETPRGAAPTEAAPEAPPSLGDRLELLGFRAVLGLIGLIPRRLALRIGAWLGDILYLLHRRGRRVALLNLARAFPDRSPSEHRAILRESIRNLGRVAAEVCHFGSLTPQNIGDYVHIDDRATWEQLFATAEQRGVLVLTGHFGNFELLAYAHGLLGHPITLVHRPMNNPLVDRAITDLRAVAGTVSLPKKSAAKAALRALHRHQIVAIPADQNQTRRYGVFVDFFGLPACTTPGPARLAMLSGAAVIPVFLLREGASDKHRVLVLPEIPLARSGDRDADVIANTQRCTAVIEDLLRRYPEQWIWFHKRWNTRAKGEPRIY